MLIVADSKIKTNLLGLVAKVFIAILTTVLLTLSLKNGRVTERLKVPVLKTGKRKLRGFESHPFRQYGEVPKLAEGDGLLNR